MPADRFLHPRCGHSEKVNLLTDLEYRVWTQYILSADDFGVMRCSAAKLQSDNDHLHNRPVKVVQRSLERLVSIGLLRTFTHQGHAYVFQHDWQDWQKVTWPSRTINPPVPASALAEVCTPATRLLFSVHPGAKKVPGKKPSEDFQSSPEELSPSRAGVPAKRLTANGSGLVASGSEGGPGETDPPMDEWIRELQAVYPAQAVTSGHMTESAFVQAILAEPLSPRVVFDQMLSNLETQKCGPRWADTKYIPRLDNWLRGGLWKQRHEVPAALDSSACGHRPPCRTMQDCTRRYLEEQKSKVAS